MTRFRLESPVRVSNSSCLTGILDEDHPSALASSIDAVRCDRKAAVAKETGHDRDPAIKMFSVLLASDDSDAARHAEDWASRGRWRRPCRVDVLCVAGYGITRLGWSMVGDRSSARQAVEQLRDAEMIAAERIANEVGLRLQQAGLSTCALARQGDVVDEIMATIEVQRPDLVVLGPRGRSRLAQMLLGSVSRQVIADTPTATLVARKPPRDEGSLPQSLLMLVDGTRATEVAVDWLVAAGWAEETQVRLLGLLGVPPGVEYDDPELVAQVSASLRDDAAHTLEGLAERLVGHGSDVGLDAATGHPVEATLQAAEKLEPDAIVVARHRGRRGQDPFAEKVARYAQTSVLMIPES